MLVDTRPTPGPICCNRQSLVYRLTVCGVSVDCQWYGISVLLTIVLPRKTDRVQCVQFFFKFLNVLFMQKVNFVKKSCA